ncbi:SPW repeat domain-containing protein [Mycolicibacter arupensis]|jgi:hypothetical protein|nr:SPW repeat protein [Mycolicibacter arupensis]MDM2351375.1 SPW repeat protein [Mycobacteroides abscessus]MDM2361537.1 SPW repeat protein [Mycobacteroides abscessus]
MKSPTLHTVGWITVVAGGLPAVIPLWMSTATTLDICFMVALGLLVTIHGFRVLFGGSPVKDHWHLCFIAILLAASPWIAGFAGDGAALLAWFVAGMLVKLTDAAYTAQRQDDAGH